MRFAASLLLRCCIGLSLRVFLNAADCNQNGVEDFQDITSGASRDCNQNSIPDDCDVQAVNFSLTVSGLLNVPLTPGAGLLLDVDSDQDIDLLVPFEQGGSVGKFLGDRTGRLVPAGSFVAVEAVEGLRGITALDLDGDQDLDLASVGFGKVTLIENRGRGSFQVQSGLTPGMGLQGIDAGDLDLDGDLDLAVVGDFQLRLLIKGGAFELAEGPKITIGSNPTEVIISDLDGDGKNDVITRNLGGNLSIARNLGAGQLDFPLQFGAGGIPQGMTTADLDGDHDLDLAAASAEGALTVILQGANFSFVAAAPVQVEPGLMSIAAADFDADGDQDLALGSANPGLVLLLNHGSAKFGKTLFKNESVLPSAIRPGDLDGDGAPELITSSRGFGTVAILAKRLAALSNDCQPDSVPDECQLSGADCNGNHKPDACDLASGQSKDCNGNQLPDECERDCNRNSVPDDCDLAARTSPDCNANGAPDECDLAAAGASFKALETFEDPGLSFPTLVAAVDADRDRDIDVVSSTSEVLVVLENSGDGHLTTISKIVGGRLPFNVASGDFDGDGDADLAGAFGGPDGVLPLINQGNGRFDPGAIVPVPGQPFFTCTGDADEDGFLDLICTLGASGNVAFLSGDGKGMFRLAGGEIPLRAVPLAIALGDLDGDQDLDLAGIGLEKLGLVVLPNFGRGKFGDPALMDLPIAPPTLVPGDFDGDSDIDFLSINLMDGGLFVASNDGNAKFKAGKSFAPQAFSQFWTAGDLDLDGDLDIVGPLANNPQGEIVVFYNDDGEFGRKDSFDQGAFTLVTALLLRDMDGDGKLDLLFSEQNPCADCPEAGQRPGGGIHVLLNTSFPGTSHDLDSDRIPDECQGRFFHRGDSNSDGALNLADAVATLQYLFQAGPAPACLEAADAENNGKIELTDAVHVLNYLFRGGPPPAAPGPPALPCGRDLDPVGAPGDIGCELYPPCV